MDISSNKQHNIIQVTSDSSRYYADLSKKYSEEAEKSALTASQKAELLTNGAQSAISEITTLKNSSITDINSTKTATLDAIDQAEEEALSSINSASHNFANINFSNITEAAKEVIRTTASGSTPSGGGGSWGSITGTLSDQTDLAQALAGKLDVGYTNSTVPYIVESNTTSQQYRYRKWSDGLLEQMGVVMVAENQSQTVTLPMNYSNVVYGCVLTPLYDGVDWSSTLTEPDGGYRAYCAWVCSKTKTAFDISSYGPLSRVSWYTFGKTSS